MSPVTLMTTHLLSLSLNKGLSSYLPMALGNFAHNYGQSCSSLWVNLPIVVGKLYRFVRHHSLSLSFSRVPYYIFTQPSQMGKLRSHFIMSIMQGINAEPLTKSGKRNSVWLSC